VKRIKITKLSLKKLIKEEVVNLMAYRKDKDFQKIEHIFFKMQFLRTWAKDEEEFEVSMEHLKRINTLYGETPTFQAINKAIHQWYDDSNDMYDDSNDMWDVAHKYRTGTMEPKMAHKIALTAYQKLTAHVESVLGRRLNVVQHT